MTAATKEYLRRNLLVASIIGARASAQAALARLMKHRRPPQWLVQYLHDVLARTGHDVSHEMAKHRDEVDPAS